MAHSYNHFVTIVAGDNYKEILEKYNKNIKVDYRVVYYKKNAKDLQQTYLSLYQSLINNQSLDTNEKEIINDTIELIKSQTPEEFFEDYTEEYEHDNDGNAISNENPNGKYTSYAIGQLFSTPFKLKNGETTFSAKKGDIDWGKMHLYNQEIYKAAWETVMENAIPKNKEEVLVYENMKNRTEYFKNFGNKETYVASSTAFWGYAFVSELTDWVELEDNINQFDWIMSYYDNFIKNLSDNTILTIIECRR